LAAAGSVAHLWSCEMHRFMFRHSENGAGTIFGLPVIGFGEGAI
jgi:hypothetical protein